MRAAWRSMTSASSSAAALVTLVWVLQAASGAERPGHAPVPAPPGKVPITRFNSTSAPGVTNGDGSAALPAPMAAPLSTIRQREGLGAAAAKTFQAAPGDEPNPRLTNGTHPTLRPPRSAVEQLQAGAPANAPSSGGALAGHPASMQHKGGRAAGDFQAKPGNVTNPRLKGAPPPHALRAFQAKTGKEPSPRLKHSTGAIPPSSHRANSTMLSTVSGPAASGSAASTASDAGTGIAMPNTVKRVEGDTVLITQVPAPEDSAAAPAHAPASSAAVRPAPAQAPVLASPQLRPPQTSKTAPVILESIPLQAALEQPESGTRGLLAADGASNGAASAPAAPPPASSAASMAAFRSVLAAELSAATQAAAAPAPSADAAAEAPSPVASAVASLATRLESGQATPALAAQLQETQSLLEAALQAVQRSIPSQAAAQTSFQAQSPSSTVSLQTLPSLAGGLSNALSIASGGSLQDAGALLALRLTNTEQELSSALSLLRRSTKGASPAMRISAAPRIVDISAAAADAPSQAAPAPAPAPAALAVSALPLLSPTDALAAALRGQDIPTSRQLTPDEDSALRITAAQVASPPGGSGNTSAASFANIVPAGGPEALAVPAAAPAGSPEPLPPPGPSPAAARAAARALAPAPAPRQDTDADGAAQRLRLSLADRQYTPTRAVIALVRDLGGRLLAAPAPAMELAHPQANTVSLALADVVDRDLQSRISLQALTLPETRAAARASFKALLTSANNDASVRPPRTFGQAAQVTRRTAEFLVSRAAHNGMAVPMPAVAAAAAGAPEAQPGMAVVAGAPAVPAASAAVFGAPAASPSARPAGINLVVINSARSAPGPADSATALSAAALSHVSRDEINPVLSASTPQQLALIFERVGTQAFAPAPASAVQPAQGPASRILLPDAAQGPGPGRSFLQIPGLGYGRSLSPDPDTLISQNWAQLNETIGLLRTGGFPISTKLQNVPAGSAGSTPKATPPSGARPDWLPVWLGGSKSRKLPAAQAGRRRRLWEAAPGSWQTAGSVLGTMQADLPGEQPGGSLTAPQRPYVKPIPDPPSGLLLYKEYTPGLTGRIGDPGFMSIFQRLSQMLGLPGQTSGQAPAAVADVHPDEPHAPAMAFNGEHIQLQQLQQQQQGPLIDAAEPAGELLAGVMRETEKRRQLISAPTVPMQQPQQESPLEVELEQMMGKPVHTLSADGSQAADAGTLLGAKLTDQQIDQLADIFADSLASGAQSAVQLTAKGPAAVPAQDSLPAPGPTPAGPLQAPAPADTAKFGVVSQQDVEDPNQVGLQSRAASLEGRIAVDPTRLPHDAIGPNTRSLSNPGPKISSEDYNLPPDGAPASGRVRIDSSGQADRAQSPAPGRSLSATSRAPAPGPSLAAMAGSAPAPTQATLTPLSAAAASEGALASAPAPAALTAVEGANVRSAQSSHDTVAPSASIGMAEGVPTLAPAPAPAPTSSATAALAVSVAEAQPVSGMSAQHPPVAAPSSSPMASQDEPSLAPVTAMPSAAPAPSASAPVQSAAPQSASGGEAARAAAGLSSLGLLSLQATGRIQKLPHGTAGSAVRGSTTPPAEATKAAPEQQGLALGPAPSPVEMAAAAPVQAPAPALGAATDTPMLEPYPAAADQATQPEAPAPAAPVPSPASEPSASVPEAFGVSSPPPPPPPPLLPLPPPPPPLPPPPQSGSGSGSRPLSTAALDSVQAAGPSAASEGAAAPVPDDSLGRARGAGGASAAPIDLAPRAAAVRGALSGAEGSASAFHSAPGAYDAPASSSAASGR